MNEAKCAWCQREIGVQEMCFEVWLRVPEEARTLLDEARSLAQKVSISLPPVKVSNGYVSQRILLCDYPCMAQYAVSCWREGEIMRGLAEEQTSRNWEK